MGKYSNTFRDATQIKIVRLSYLYTCYCVAIRNYRLLCSLPLYWDQLAKLNWWLMTSDEALALPHRVVEEYEKLQVLIDVAEVSERHEKLLDAFLAFGMLGRQRPKRPGTKAN